MYVASHADRGDNSSSGPDDSSDSDDNDSGNEASGNENENEDVSHGRHQKQQKQKQKAVDLQHRKSLKLQDEFDVKFSYTIKRIDEC